MTCCDFPKLVRKKTFNSSRSLKCYTIWGLFFFPKAYVRNVKTSLSSMVPGFGIKLEPGLMAGLQPKKEGSPCRGLLLCPETEACPLHSHDWSEGAQPRVALWDCSHVWKSHLHAKGESGRGLPFPLFLTDFILHHSHVLWPLVHFWKYLSSVFTEKSDFIIWSPVTLYAVFRSDSVIIVHKLIAVGFYDLMWCLRQCIWIHDEQW